MECVCLRISSDHDAILFLSRHFTSKTVDVSDAVVTAAMDGGTSGNVSAAFVRDWNFPRLLQRIQLPAGERLASMEKVTFPYYFHDLNDDADAETQPQGDEVRLSEIVIPT